jgi:hypothetical protein
MALETRDGARPGRAGRGGGAPRPHPLPARGRGGAMVRLSGQAEGPGVLREATGVTGSEASGLAPPSPRSGGGMGWGSAGRAELQ